MLHAAKFAAKQWRLAGKCACIRVETYRYIAGTDRRTLTIENVDLVVPASAV